MKLSWCSVDLDWVPSTLALVPHPWPREVALLWLRYVQVVTLAGGRAWCPVAGLRDQVPGRRDLAQVLGLEERDAEGRVLRRGWVADGRSALPGGFGGARQLLEEGAWRDALIEERAAGGDLSGTHTSPASPPQSPRVAPASPPQAPQVDTASGGNHEDGSPASPPRRPRSSPASPPHARIRARTDRTGQGHEQDPPPPTPPAGGAGVEEPARGESPGAAPAGTPAPAQAPDPGAPPPASGRSTSLGHGVGAEPHRPPAWWPARRGPPADGPPVPEVLEAVLDCLEGITGERPHPDACAVGGKAVLAAWRDDGRPELHDLRRRVAAVVSWARHLEGRRAEGSRVEDSLWLGLQGDATSSPSAVLQRGPWPARWRAAVQRLERAGYTWDGRAWSQRATPSSSATSPGPALKPLSLLQRVRGRFLGAHPRGPNDRPLLEQVLDEVVAELGEEAEEAQVLDLASRRLARAEHEASIARQAAEAQARREAGEVAVALRKAREERQARRAAGRSACGA